jgi:hypothetical protein
VTKPLMVLTISLFIALALSIAGGLRVSKQLAEQKAFTSMATDRALEYAGALDAERKRNRELEKARIVLQERLDFLANQEERVVTEIREVWRDRIIREDPRLSVDCSGVSVPADALRLFCEASASTAGACAQPSNSS